MEKNDIDKLTNPTLWAQEKAFWTFDPDTAIEILNKELPIRRIDEELKKIINDKAKERGKTYDKLKDELLHNLCPRENFNDKDEFDKEYHLTYINLENWLTGIAKTIERDSAIKIAFALQMTYEETEAFLKRCWLDGFYMRDVKDVIYRQGLKSKWDYYTIEEMIKAFSYLDIDNSDPEVSESIQEKLDAEKLRLTEYLSTQTGSDLSKEELVAVIQQNEQFFGSFRRKAHERFQELYEKIEEVLRQNKELYEKMKKRLGKDDELEREGTIPNLKKETLMQLYDNFCKKCREKVPQFNEWLEVCIQQPKISKGKAEVNYMIVKDIPKLRKNGRYATIIHHLIAEKVPGRATMSEIIKKTKRDGKIKEKVDRKPFMLAWLASSEGDIDNFQEENPEEDFMEHMLTLNDHLRAHGMAELDARHPFDWIVMNSIRYSYIDDKAKNKDDFDIEDRLYVLIEKMLDEIEE